MPSISHLSNPKQGLSASGMPPLGADFYIEEALQGTKVMLSGMCMNMTGQQ